MTTKTQVELSLLVLTSRFPGMSAAYTKAATHGIALRHLKPSRIIAHASLSHRHKNICAFVPHVPSCGRLLEGAFWLFANGLLEENVFLIGVTTSADTNVWHYVATSHSFIVRRPEASDCPSQNISAKHVCIYVRKLSGDKAQMNSRSALL